MPDKNKNDDASYQKFQLEEPEDMMLELDPHLQEVILASRKDETIPPSVANTAEDGTVTVDVIAKLADPNEEVPGLNVVRKIGNIVTGTVEVEQIEAVRAHANVQSLKRATQLHEDLQFSVPEIRADSTQIQAALPPNSPVVDGTDVIVGIVDYGGDFVHNDFRNSDGTTRLLFLWDQRGGLSDQSPDGFGYGRELDADAINQALQTANPYQTLAYNPGSGAHGTHVMDIAAGNGRATGNPGVAPGADLIFVHVSAWDIGAEDSFGNSRRLLEAVDYIFTRAQELCRPAVVNLSLGTHGGPHDGSTLVEQGFDNLLQTPGRAIVISAGNSWGRASHTNARLDPDSQSVLGWNIQFGDQTDNELEIWYSGDQELAVALITPGGQRLGPVDLGQTVNLMAQNKLVGRIIHRQHDPNNGDNQIDILLDRTLVGNWGVEVTNESAEEVEFHAWIERDDFGQSRFSAANDVRSHTLGSISCGEHTLVVGSYDARLMAHPLSSFTSEGPTRDGKSKPEISAPGQAIVAARSGTQGVTSMSGTSMAAPHVTGVVALLMQAANHNLTITEIRDALMNTARHNPPPALGWHGRYGEGRIDALAAISTQLAGIDTDLAVRPVPSPAIRDQAPLSGENLNWLLDRLLVSMTNAAAEQKMHVRIEIEVDPVTE